MINYESTVKNFRQPLDPGNYVMPFGFELPMNLPGSVAHYDFQEEKKEDF